MTLITKEGRKAGKTEYIARIWRWSPESEEHEFRISRIFPNAGLAKAWIARTIQAGENGEIEVGTYIRDDIHDAEYGHIVDAYWEPDYDKALSTFKDTDESPITWN